MEDPRLIMPATEFMRVLSTQQHISGTTELQPWQEAVCAALGKLVSEGVDLQMLSITPTRMAPIPMDQPQTWALQMEATHAAGDTPRIIIDDFEIDERLDHRGKRIATLEVGSGWPRGAGAGVMMNAVLQAGVASMMMDMVLNTKPSPRDIGLIGMEMDPAVFRKRLEQPAFEPESNRGERRASRQGKKHKLRGLR